jgi:hypothetical protein
MSPVSRLGCYRGSMTKRATYFEQIPVALAKELGRRWLADKSSNPETLYPIRSSCAAVPTLSVRPDGHIQRAEPLVAPLPPDGRLLPLRRVFPPVGRPEDTTRDTLTSLPFGPLPLRCSLPRPRVPEFLWGAGAGTRRVPGVPAGPSVGRERRPSGGRSQHLDGQ